MQTFSLLVKNSLYEVSMTRAIIVMSIPNIIIYPSVLVPMLHFAVAEDYKMISLLFTVLDVLQFLNFSHHLFLLMAMLPSFRRSTKKVWPCLWNKEQNSEEGETSNDWSLSDSTLDNSSSQTDETGTTD